MAGGYGVGRGELRGQPSPEAHFGFHASEPSVTGVVILRQQGGGDVSRDITWNPDRRPNVVDNT